MQSADMSDFSRAKRSQLPDPDLDAAFYEGVTLKRAIAWFIDFVVIALLAVPVMLIFGVLTLGFGFLAAPFLFAAIAFAYRVVLIAGPGVCSSDYDLFPFQNLRRPIYPLDPDCPRNA